jgi:hypothetical protein
MREAHPDCHKPLAPTFRMTGAWAFRVRASGVAAKAGSRGSLKKTCHTARNLLIK